MAKKSLISRRSFLKKTIALNVTLALNACGGGIGTGSPSPSNSGTPSTSNTDSPSSLSYSFNPATYTINTTIASNTPSHGGGKPSSYSVSPPLPTGLSLNPTTGVISGTPTAVTANANFVVTASNSAGSTTATLSIAVNSAATNKGGYDGVIRVGTGVNSNRLVNGAGQVIQLRGANFPGLESTAVHQWSPGNPWAENGGIENIATYATWKPNVARVPLNASSWLGLTCQVTAGANGSPEWSGTDLPADPGGNYRQFVIDGVAALQAIGCYVIFDLHWSAPQFTFNNVTKYLMPDGQSAFADYDTAVPFWQSMADTFGTQATAPTSTSGLPINNAGIIFDLFNEPFLNQNGYTLTTTKGGSTTITPQQALRDGGWSTAFINNSQGGTNYVITQDWQLAGYQQMLDTIRATGADNICMVAGNYWAQDLAQYKTFMPTDSANQLAFSWHAYPQGGYPYSGGNNYPSCGSYGTGAKNAAAFDPADNIIAAGYPVIIGEDGGYGGTNNTANDDPHFTTMVNWVDQQPGASYVVWQWNFTQGYGTTDAYNYLTAFAADGTTVLPIQGCGNVLYNWMVNHA